MGGRLPIRWPRRWYHAAQEATDARAGDPRPASPWSSSGIVWYLFSWALTPLIFVWERLIMATSRYRLIGHIRVGVFRSGKAEALWPTVDEALRIIWAADPLRFDALRRDFDRIIVFPGNASSFSELTKVCYLSQRWVEKFGALNCATALVHEAMHARLRRRGLGAWGPQWKARIEELCIDEQIAFVRLLPRDVFTNLDELLRYLEDQKRTYPATWTWPPRLRDIRARARAARREA
jgi:hypothetical protein